MQININGKSFYIVIVSSSHESHKSIINHNLANSYKLQSLNIKLFQIIINFCTFNSLSNSGSVLHLKVS